MTTTRYTCRKVRGLLPLHVGGDLEPKHTSGVEEHLHACLSCFREFRELAGVRGRLGALAEEPLPAGILDGFAEEVMARIALEEPGPAAEPPRSLRGAMTPVRWAAAAGIMVAALLGLSRMDSSMWSAWMDGAGNPVANGPGSGSDAVGFGGSSRMLGGIPSRLDPGRSLAGSRTAPPRSASAPVIASAPVPVDGSAKPRSGLERFGVFGSGLQPIGHELKRIHDSMLQPDFDRRLRLRR